MRKIKKPIRKELRPVKLYLDDLQSICEILKQKTKSIDITTEDYDVKDIKQLNSLEIKKIHNSETTKKKQSTSIEYSFVCN